MTDRTWRPITGSTKNGLSSERVARRSRPGRTRAAAACMRPRPSPRISWAGPRSSLADSSWSRPRCACRRGLDQLERGDGAPDHDDDDDAEPDQPVAAPVRPRRRRRRRRESPTRGGCIGGGFEGSDMGGQFYGLGAENSGTPRCIATSRSALTTGRYGRWMPRGPAGQGDLGHLARAERICPRRLRRSTTNTHGRTSAATRGWRVSNRVTEEVRLAHTDLALPRPTGSRRRRRPHARSSAASTTWPPGGTSPCSRERGARRRRGPVGHRSPRRPPPRRPGRHRLHRRRRPARDPDPPASARPAPGRCLERVARGPLRAAAPRRTGCGTATVRVAVADLVHGTLAEDGPRRRGADARARRPGWTSGSR